MNQSTLDSWDTQEVRKVNWNLDVCIVVSDSNIMKGGNDQNGR